jgi:hypothetical protein
MRNATNWAIAILAGEYSPNRRTGVNPQSSLQRTMTVTLIHMTIARAIP